MVTSPCDELEREPQPELIAEHVHLPHFKPGAEIARPLLCWGSDCVWNGVPTKRPVPRPITLEHRHEIGGPTVGITPVAAVKDDQACTADRCDPLGPNAKAAIASASSIQVTSDREALVIDSRVWSRSKDREIAFPPALKLEGEIETVTVLGNWIAYGRGCNEYCNETGRVLDSRGRLASTNTFPIGGANGPAHAPIDLAGDRFLVFTSFDDVTLIEKGKPTAHTSVGAARGVIGDPPVSARVIALAIDDDEVAMEVCTRVGCELATLRVDQWDEGPNRPQSSHLAYHVERQLPRCTLAPAE